VVKTIKEFKSELKMIRKELYKSSEFADPKLVASWLDRLLISLEELSPKLDLMMIEIEQLSKSSGKAASGRKAKKKSKKSRKKTKKPAKKSKKKTKKKTKKKRR